MSRLASSNPWPLPPPFLRRSTRGGTATSARTHKACDVGGHDMAGKQNGEGRQEARCCCGERQRHDQVLMTEGMRCCGCWASGDGTPPGAEEMNAGCWMLDAEEKVLVGRENVAGQLCLRCRSPPSQCPVGFGVCAGAPKALTHTPYTPLAPNTHGAASGVWVVCGCGGVGGCGGGAFTCAGLARPPGGRW